MISLVRKKFHDYTMRKEGKRIILIPLVGNIDKKKMRDIQIQFVDQLREFRRKEIKALKEIRDEDAKEAIEREVDKLFRDYVERFMNKIKAIGI